MFKGNLLVGNKNDTTYANFIVEPFQCWGYFRPKHKDFEKKHLNPAMLVFIEWLSLSTFRWVPICQGFGHFQVFCIILYRPN